MNGLDQNFKQNAHANGGFALRQVAEGNGPVNALAKALFRALLPTFPTLLNVVLSDYKVRLMSPLRHLWTLTVAPRVSSLECWFYCYNTYSKTIWHMAYGR